MTMDTPDLVGWDINEQNKRTIFMQHMYERSGRTNGLLTGLWQEFCLKEAGPYCKEMWFEQQRAIKDFLDQAAFRQLEKMDPNLIGTGADARDDVAPCSEEDDCKEPFVPTLHD